MAVDIMGQRVGKGTLKAFSDDDADELDTYPINKPLRIQVTGSRKERSYRELKCYKGSCKYIANLDLNEDMNTTRKVDHLTKIQCGFVEDTVYDENTKRVHWIVKSLGYANCDQPESHRFIATALEKHAALAGIKDVDDYVELLNEQK